MAEERVTKDPMYPEVPIREDLEVFVNEDMDCIIVKDKASGEVLCDQPLKFGPE